MATGYKLSDDFLKNKINEYNELGEVDFTYQEYIESMYAPTQWLYAFFIENNLPFKENISHEMSQDKKFEIVQFCIKKSYDKLDGIGS